MNSRKMISFASILLAVFSCKNDPTKLEQIEDAYDAVVTQQCECAVQTDASLSIASCRDAVGPFLDEDSDRDCANEVLTDPTYAPWVDCTLQARRQWADCLKDEPCLPDFWCKDLGWEIPGSLVCDGRLDCADGSDEANCDGVPPSCRSQFLQAVDLCEPRVDGFLEALDACVRTRMCANGEEIPESEWCDGEADCEDGSDEASC